MNYHFILREAEGSGYKIECRFSHLAAIEFAMNLLGETPEDNVQAVFEAHEAEGHAMFSVGSVGALTLVAVRD